MLATSLLKRQEGVLSTEVDGEAVLMSINNSRYYTLDSIGSVIWSLLEKPQILENLQAELTDRFDGECDVINKESLEYLQKLEERKLIVAT